MTFHAISYAALAGALCLSILAEPSAAQGRLESSDPATAERCRAAIQAEAHNSAERIRRVLALGQCDISGPVFLERQWETPSTSAEELNALAAVTQRRPDIRVLRRLNSLAGDASALSIHRRAAIATIVGVLVPFNAPVIRRDDHTNKIHVAFPPTDHAARDITDQAIPFALRKESEDVLAGIVKAEPDRQIRELAASALWTLQNSREGQR